MPPQPSTTEEAMNSLITAYDHRLATLTASQNRFAKGIAWLPQEPDTFVPLSEARIPILDQGFLHSDLTYDVPAIWDGRFFRVNDHLDRFEASAKKMRMNLPMPKKDIKRLLAEMAKLSGMRDAYCMLILTRGLERVPKGPDAIQQLARQSNNLYLYLQPYVWVMSPEMQLQGGGSAIVTQGVRRTHPESFDPTVKNLQWGDLTNGIIEASERGSWFPILLDGNGLVTEGSGYNIFLITKSGVFLTPKRGVLEGVTRRTVLEICERMGWEARVQDVPVREVFEADEIFLCTTAGGVMPIREVDGRMVGDGGVGRRTGVVWRMYWGMHYEEGLSEGVEYERARL